MKPRERFHKLHIWHGDDYLLCDKRDSGFCFHNCFSWVPFGTILHLKNISNLIILSQAYGYLTEKMPNNLQIYQMNSFSRNKALSNKPLLCLGEGQKVFLLSPSGRDGWGCVEGWDHGRGVYSFSGLKQCRWWQAGLCPLAPGGMETHLEVN